jgi:hypothetical protein
MTSDRYWLRVATLTTTDRELVFSSLTAMVGFIQSGVRIRRIGVQTPGRPIHWE